MTIVDKKNFLGSVQNTHNVALELGCGNRKRIANAVGIDALDYECVDIVGDIFDVLKQFPDNSIDAIYSFHFFEHISDLSLLISEIGRILKTGGKLEVVVPHFSNPYFYSDYTHSTFFGLYSFCYFAKNSMFERQVPTYGRNINLDLCQVELIFKSPRPFYVRYLLKKLLQQIFNVNNWMKEFYEENLCNIFPCYEIKYQLKKIDSINSRSELLE